MQTTDFRLMEALGSGALVMVDHMYVPRPDPLVHGQHIIYYGASLCMYICMYVCMYLFIYLFIPLLVLHYFYNLLMLCHFD